MAFLFYFECMNWICLNGKMHKADKPVLLSSNRGFKYGDALFETMKVVNGKIVLAPYHYERLFSGLRLLQFKGISTISGKNLSESILELCKLNRCNDLGRVRLTVFRGNGNLNDNKENLQYLIECWQLDESSNRLNKDGLVIDIFPDARKSCDKFSNFKSADYLPFIMATIYAKKNKLDDCFLLNTYERVCEATIANIFWVKNNRVFTPPLSEGCVAGVMRRYLVEKIKNVLEKPCSINDLENADEIFITNAIKGINWVKQFKRKHYFNEVSLSLSNNFF